MHILFFLPSRLCMVYLQPFLALLSCFWTNHQIKKIIKTVNLFFESIALIRYFDLAPFEDFLLFWFLLGFFGGLAQAQSIFGPTNVNKCNLFYFLATSQFGVKFKTLLGPTYVDYKLWLGLESGVCLVKLSI